MIPNRRDLLKFFGALPIVGAAATLIRPAKLSAPAPYRLRYSLSNFNSHGGRVHHLVYSMSPPSRAEFERIRRCIRESDSMEPAGTLIWKLENRSLYWILHEPVRIQDIERINDELIA